MVNVLGMATIIFMMTNDHSRMVAIIGAIWRILTIWGRVTFLGMVTILRIVTIIGVVTILKIVAVFCTILRDGYIILGS